jgi:hypothetical protein
MSGEWYKGFYISMNDKGLFTVEGEGDTVLGEYKTLKAAQSAVTTKWSKGV